MRRQATRILLWTLAAATSSGAARAQAANVDAPVVCFAPGTPPERVAEVYARARASETGLGSPSDFRLGSRWSSTATNPGPLGQGTPVTLTWSVVPDGTTIPSGFAGDVAGPSVLQARLNGLYGSPAVWIPLFQQVFDRWHQLTGISYVYQPTDDGAAFPNTPGQLGVRGDVRISGRFIDGNSGILAYNYFPNSGDMVIDAPDTFYNTTTNGSLRLRNVVSHEHGHGIGHQHVCPVNQTKLMEPFVSTAFTGPQHDDTLGGQRQYGDARENNDSSGGATDLGGLPNGVTTLSDSGTDNNVDPDFFRFTVPAGKQAAVTLTPVGFTYLEGPQNGDGSCTAGSSFDSLVLNDLGVQLLGTDGATVLASANANPAGVPESIPVTVLPGGGSFFVRVNPGPANQVQLYTLGIDISNAITVSVNDVSVTEGNAGTTNATFTLSLSASSALPVTVNFATANGTAVAPGDYTAQSGSRTFSPGVTTQTVSVPVVGDLAVEPNETFTLNVTGVTNAIVLDGQGIGTILNDDLPSLSVNDVTVTEGNAGTTNATFTLSLSASSTLPVTVNFTTADGTATAPGDYTAQSGSRTFNPGVTTQTVSVPVVGDLTVEPNEAFALNLTGASNGTIADGQGIGTILNDDVPSLSVNDVTVTEGDTGTLNATFTVSLSQVVPFDVSVSYAAAPGTATAGVDFGSVAGTVGIPAGSSSATVAVPVVGDRVNEPTETFFLNLSGPSNATIADGQGQGNITDNDAAGFSIADVTVRERVAATATATFIVTLSPTQPGTVTVDFATANGTATAGSDYVATNGTLTFPAGQPTQPINVTVNPDALTEGLETFTVNLSGSSGPPIAVGAATGRILDKPLGGDFNADDRNDLLWRHDVSGENVLWFMNGPTLLSGTFTNPPTLSDVRWKMVGTNDFNVDGRPDILWRHNTSGENVLWFMNGATLVSGTFLTPSALTDVRWNMSGTGDFNLDGRPDILWRHNTSGEIVVWFMNGSVLASGTFLTPPAFTDVNWQTVGTGDFNGDGKTDILWRHALSGQNVVWFMDGTSLVSGAFTNPPALVDTNWRMVATSDYNFDGKVDIVWRHSTSGQNVMWFMDGINLISGTFTNPSSLPDTNWKIVGPR
jgi:hypothetical protein